MERLIMWVGLRAARVATPVPARTVFSCFVQIGAPILAPPLAQPLLKADVELTTARIPTIGKDWRCSGMDNF
jgi:hypothetical protein